VELAVVAPDSVDVGPDGTIWVAEGSTGRLVASDLEGPKQFLRPSTVPAPRAVAVADDGTVVVAGGSDLARISTDGTETPVPVTGVSDIDAVDVGADGTIYLADPPSNQVLQITTAGTQSDVGFTGLTAVRGIDVDDAGTVSVLDTDLDDVVQRTSAGVQTPVGFTGLTDPVALHVTRNVMVVTQPSAVITRGETGFQQTIPDLSQPNPTDIHSTRNGTVLESFLPDTACRCPAGPGGVLRTDGRTGSTRPLPLGDVASFGTIASPADATVLFNSSPGAPGYSEPNPLRQVVGEDAPTDIDTSGTDGAMAAAAPDGTLYVVGRGPGAGLTRRSPDGSVAEVPLPTEPGRDTVVAAFVDSEGRLFVALGSGYGTGAFAIVEPYATGGPRTWYEAPEQGSSFDALGAGGGLVAYSAFEDGAHVLRWLSAPGTTEATVDLSDVPVNGLALDGEGTALVLRPGDTSTEIERFRTDGATSALTYQGQRIPQQIAVGPDGTVYVADAEVGLLALDGAAAPATGGAPPATPIPGRAGYTG